MCSGPSHASRYGKKEWLAKEGCQRITRKSCNLTTETGNHTEHYYARVTAVSAGGRSATKMTDRFSSMQQSEWPLLTAGERGSPAGLCILGRGQREMWLSGKVTPTRASACSWSSFLSGHAPLSAPKASCHYVTTVDCALSS